MVTRIEASVLIRLTGESLRLRRLANPPIFKYAPQKYQTGKATPSGFLFACPIGDRGYNIVPDNADELQLLLTAPYETATGLQTPLTLPEYAVEVRLPC